MQTVRYEKEHFTCTEISSSHNSQKLTFGALELRRVKDPVVGTQHCSLVALRP